MGFLIALHIVVCIFLVAIILIQPGKGDAGISFGSSGQSIFASKSASNFLTKTTTVCAIIFLLTSFFLTRGRLTEYNKSVISASETTESSSATNTETTESNAVEHTDTTDSSAVRTETTESSAEGHSEGSKTATKKAKRPQSKMPQK